MPARQDESPESRALREIEAEDENAVQALVAAAGPPPGVTVLSDADEDQAWETMDPLVDDEAFATMLMTQGLPPEIAQRLLIVQINKDDQERQQAWLAALTQPTQDAELADQLTRAVKWPYRSVLLEDIDDPDDLVAKADTLDRRYQKRVTGMQQAISEPGTVRTTAGYGGMDEVGY